MTSELAIPDPTPQPPPAPLLDPEQRAAARRKLTAGHPVPLTKMVMFSGLTENAGVKAIAENVTRELQAEAEALGGTLAPLTLESVEMVRDCPGCPLRPAYAGERPTIVQVTARALVMPRRDGAPEVTA